LGGEDLGGFDDLGDTSGGSDKSGNDKPFDDEPFDAGVEASEESDPKKYIQQLSGKLGQSLRKFSETDGVDLELEKFAVNSVLSATHTSQMDSEDQNDIIDKVKTSGNNSEDKAKEEPNNDAVSDAPNDAVSDAPTDGEDLGGFDDLGDEENFGENFQFEENSSTFVDETKKIDEMIDKALEEIMGAEPDVKPVTTPTITPVKTPRREKPWKVTPGISPTPKATE